MASQVGSGTLDVEGPGRQFRALAPRDSQGADTEAAITYLIPVVAGTGPPASLTIHLLHLREVPCRQWPDGWFPSDRRKARQPSQS